LYVPVLLGLPFLCNKNIIVDHSTRITIDKTIGFNLLNPIVTDGTFTLMKYNVLTELKSLFQNKHKDLINTAISCIINAELITMDVTKTLADLANVVCVKTQV
jgi:hypothetical protein